jgi:hypothetical protein
MDYIRNEVPIKMNLLTFARRYCSNILMKSLIYTTNKI